jgi:hypothetical protein
LLDRAGFRTESVLPGVNRFNTESLRFRVPDSKIEPVRAEPSDKLHLFNPVVAESHGTSSATIYQYLAWHCRNFGKWVGRMDSLLKTAPYLSRKELRGALHRLLGDGCPKLLTRRPEGGDRYHYALTRRVRGGKPHAFDPRMAAKYGILTAVIYDNTLYWINEAAITGEDEPSHYTTPAEAQKLYPYAAFRSIERAFQVLRDEGELIAVGKKGRFTAWSIPLGLNKLDRWRDLHRPQYVNKDEPLVRMPEPVLED